MPLMQSCDVDVSPAFHPRGSHSILVGCNRNGDGQGARWWPEEGGHAISFGMTRSGKGVQIIGALCQYLGSTLTIDPVGANAWATAQRRRQLGQRVVILDPFDEVNRRYGALAGVKEQTTRFNPLSVIDPRSPDFAEDVMMLAEAIIIPQGTDPHWTESARALVAGLIAATIENAPRGQASFRQVRKLLTTSDAELAAAIKILHDRNPTSFAGRNLRRFASGSKEVGSIRSTADTQTFPFESLRLLDSMETDENAFNFAELATGRVSVFLVLPVDRLATYGRWLRLIITLAIRAITRAPRPPSPPVLFILDELGTINPGGGLRMVEQAYGLMAGQGIRIWAFLQDLKQLQHDYPNSWETFIANSEFIQLLKVNDNSTAQYFSTRLGQTEEYEPGEITWIPSSHKNSVLKKYLKEIRTDDGQPTGMWQDRPRVKGLMPVMRPDQLIGLPVSENICMFSGGQAFRLGKVNYYKDARYRGLYRDTPNYPPPPSPKPAPARPATATPQPKPVAAAPSVPPVNVEKVAELGRAAAGKVSGWFTAGREAVAAAAAARAEAKAAAAEAEKRRTAEQAAIEERARWVQMMKDAK